MKYKNKSPHGVYVQIGGAPVFITPNQEFESSEVVSHPHIEVIEEDAPIPVVKKQTTKKVTRKKPITNG